MRIALKPAPLKTVGAIVSIVAALGGLTWGAWGIWANIQKTNAELSQRQLEITQAKGEQQQRDLELKQVDLQIARERKASVETEFRLKRELFDLELSAKRVDANAARKQTEQGKVGRLVDELFKSQEPVPVLAQLVSHATSEYWPILEYAIVARLNAAKSAPEIALSFKILESAGPDALNAVLEINRNALTQCIAGVAGPFWHKVSDLASPNVGEDVEDVWLDLGRQLEREGMPVELINWIGLRETGLGYPYKTLFEIKETTAWHARVREKVLGLDIATLRRAMPLQTIVLDKTKRLLIRLLPNAKRPVGLDGIDLTGVRLPASTYPLMNFERSVIAGLDITEATLDAGSLASLNRALHSRGIRATPAQLQVIDRGRP